MTARSAKVGYMKQLEWAIRLSQVNLNSLRQGDWLNLREELHDFAYDEPIPSDYRRETFLEKASPKSLGEIQRELKSRFDQCVKMYSQWEKTGLSTGVFGIRPFDVTQAKVHLTAWTPDLAFHLTLRSEDLKTDVLLKVAATFAASGVTITQIRQCPNAECGRFFLLRMKPRSDRNFHCSHRCAVLAATRKYRKNKRNELRANDRSRYAKKQRAKFGARTRVGRGKL